ncbi:MAG: cytochrome P460 family protein [Nitrosomonas sp.]|nr:cytochrome P460 family protein [Nitrosomonas sp.]
MTTFKKALLASIVPLLLSGMLVAQTTAVASDNTERKYGRFTKDNDLLTPRNYREWVLIGASVTPNDMNDGSAAFPEFHNVYIDPNSYGEWKITGKFRDGTLIVKELVSVGTKAAPSGNGYFPGEFNGIAAMVKDEGRFPDRPGNWAYFGFESYDVRTGAIQADEACSACHQANADQDQVFTQFYPVLRAAKPGSK